MKKLLLMGALMAAQANGATQFTINSLDFANDGKVPREFTGEGKNNPPRLAWENAPKNTKSFVLIVDDPDAPKPETPWVHWVVYNIPAQKNTLDHIKSRNTQLSDGIMQGKNSWPHPGYDGPMPPEGDGAHHYYFKLYALDTLLKLKPGVTKEEVEKAMKGHILAQAEIVGLYERK